MVKNYWYAVSQSSLIEKKPLRLLRFELKLVFWRNSQGNLVCLEDRCAHRGSSLGLGKVVDGCIECPYHGFRYGSDGKCTQVPSNGVKSQIPKSLKVRSFPVRESNGIVWLWWGEPQITYPELPWFNEFSDPGAPYVEISRETPISFCRGMEANLDFAHFYFVHRFFKIPGLGPVADPFEASVKENLIEVQGNLRPEVNPQRKWGKSHETGVSVKGYVLFPGLAAYDPPGKNPQGERTFVAMSPITENKSWLLIRIYYPNNAFKFIYRFYWKNIFLKFLFPIIHQQDLRVIQEQVPQSSGLHSDLLVSCADQGITHYLRLWSQALKLDKDQEQIRKSYVREA